jgi:hypothetical protein
MAHDVHINGFDSGRGRAAGRSMLLAFAAVLLTVALALVDGARALHEAPAIALGPISVSDGTAVVTGSVGRDSTAEAHLEINGQPVGVDASGFFSAVVDLDGESFVVLTLVTGGDETITIRIPLTVLEGGGEDLLDALQDAGITLDVPPEGFQVVDDQPPTASGHVLDQNKLASLRVNDKEALGLLGPDGSFSIPLVGSPKQVTVEATDRQGVSQTSAFRTTQVTSVIKTKAGKSVSAAGAQGIVIAKIRFDKRNLLAKKSLGVVLTVKDRRGYLVRGAALHLKGMPLRYLANGAKRASFTNRIGQKRFGYLLSKRAFTDRAPRRLTLVVRASTTRASTRTTVRFWLPAVLPI